MVANATKYVLKLLPIVYFYVTAAEEQEKVGCAKINETLILWLSKH